MDLKHVAVLFAAGAFAGAINSVAGGGTLLTFPALLWTNMLATAANATSTFALLPGAMTSLWGYRKEVGTNYSTILKFMIPSLIGGVVGAFLLLSTPPEVFKRLVPYLILAATLLFVFQEPLSRYLRKKAEETRVEAGSLEILSNSFQNEISAVASPEEAETPIPAVGSTLNPVAEPPEEDSFTPAAWVGAILFQFLVAVYGGYFGAGAGILMLASFGLMGFRNIHRMNGLKNINALCINVIASLMFIAHGLIKWDFFFVMAAGAGLGGYAGSGIAKKIGQKNVRRVVIIIGFSLTLTMLIKS